MSFLPSTVGRSRAPRLSNITDFDDLFSLFRADWPFREFSAAKSFRVDVQEKDHEYIVKADIPGVRKENIDVTLANQLLTISVEQREEKEGKEEGGYVVRERSYESSQRSVMLPFSGSPENVKAELRDGVLEVHVKKSPENQKKKIPVQ